MQRTWQEIQKRGECKKQLGAYPLDSAELHVIRVLGKVDIEYCHFLYGVSGQSGVYQNKQIGCIMPLTASI